LNITEGAEEGPEICTLTIDTIFLSLQAQTKTGAYFIDTLTTQSRLLQALVTLRKAIYEPKVGTLVHKRGHLFQVTSLTLSGLDETSLG
jgi:hypothetical protein